MVEEYKIDIGKTMGIFLAGMMLSLSIVFRMLDNSAFGAICALTGIVFLGFGKLERIKKK